jgi:hypothetical protein
MRRIETSQGTRFVCQNEGWWTYDSTGTDKFTAQYGQIPLREHSRWRAFRAIRDQRIAPSEAARDLESPPAKMEIEIPSTPLRKS